MRKKYTFLLTILPTEDDDEALHGRIQLVQSSRADTFTSVDELKGLIHQALENFLNTGDHNHEMLSIEAAHDQNYA
jgi:hypothetical protein